MILVLGPSCSGKTSYILNRFDGSEARIVFAHQLDRILPQRGDIVHYNLLLGCTPGQKLPSTGPEQIIDQPRLTKLLQTGIVEEVILLRSARSVLIARAEQRVRTEPNETHRYLSEGWAKILAEVDLERCERQALGLVKVAGIMPRVIRTDLQEPQALPRQA